VHVLTVNISSNTCTVWYTIYGISTPYREEQNIYCYVVYIQLLWWVPKDGPSVSKHVAVYICYKWCITDCIYWTIYWLFFNLALFHCTITAASHKYRPTAVHDVSNSQPFCASNCAVFSSSVYVCYMWDWEMWRVYWLCCIETWQVWISISWMLCGLLKWNTLGYCCGQREVSFMNSYHYHNGSPLYCVYTCWWIHCTMNCPDQCCNHSTTVTLTSLVSMFSKWTVQCVHLHNMQHNCDSAGLILHNWVEDTEVLNRMKKIVYLFQNSILIFNKFNYF